MNIDKLLEGIQKPARYIGGEYNSIRKPWEKTAVKICLSYPDIYEVGMSYLGGKILYHLLNRESDILCERVFAPWPDMEARLRETNIPLFSLESRRPLGDFDIIGFSFGYELTYTNFLNMLDLGGIPIFSKERKSLHPIVIAGGPCVFNPAPLSEFVDVFFIGEAEEAIHEFLEIYKKLKTKGAGREETLKATEGIEGLYIPSMHKGYKIEKRVIENLENSFYPVKPIVPFIRTIHDRVAIEIMRGCPNKCRFCQAKFLYKPLRLRSKSKISELVKHSLENTGYEQVSFLSLSSSNHPHLIDIINTFNKDFSGRGISVSIPSLKIEKLSARLPNLIAAIRKTGFTFAPEAGTLNLRKRLNKQIETDELFRAAREAFKSGWRRLKLYFMIGLPDESVKDLEGIAEIAHKLSDLKKEIDGKPAELTLSINNFIPKPHTPFQWLGMEEEEKLAAKQNYLKKIIRYRRIKLDFQNINLSFLESAISRGDKRLNNVIFNAWRRGARFDSWREFLKIDAWEKAFSDYNLSLYTYARRRFRFDESLPWDFIDTGTTKEYLIEEAKKAGIGE